MSATSTAVYTVTGMTCAHCVNAVSSELIKLSGVRDVNVELNPDGPSRVSVVSDVPLDVGAVRDAIDEAGYALEGATS